MPGKTLKSVAVFLALLLCVLSGSRVQAQPEYRPAYAQAFSAWADRNGEEESRDQARPLPERQSAVERSDSSSAQNRRPETGAYELGKPSIPAAKTPEPSPVEALYTGRAGGRLTQFGYDLFGVPQPETQEKLREAAEKISAMPMGAVQDDFILGSGDEIEVVFTGQRTDRERYTINNDGLLIVTDMPPIPAAGRSMGQVRISLEAAARNLHNTEVYISLSSVRQIGVLVVGHVKKPGRQTLTVFNTVLDALMAAGGIDRAGSLRQIKLVRQGRSTVIDLYGLLLHGSTSMDLRLRDGDRLMIPALGPTVAVAGEVKRPGIYEILPAATGLQFSPGAAAQALSLNDMLELGGGVLTPGQNRYLNLELTPDGRETVSETHKAGARLFGDGSILLVAKGQEKRADMVELTGHTRKPGLYALAEAGSLSALLASERVPGPDIYPLIGVIERWDPEQLSTRLIGFPPLLVLKDSYDRQLQDGDKIHLFSRTQIFALDGGNAKEGEEPQARLQEAALGNPSPEEPEDEAIIEDPALASFLKERAAFVRGAVRRPGAYPVADGTTLDSLLAAAGGLALEANTANIEVTSNLQGEGNQESGRSGTRRLTFDFRETGPGAIPIGPGDAVRINQKFRKVAEKSVLIIGEVHNPGRYDLLPGDKVSDLLDRAGGLTDQAYAEGSIFSRESERRAEKSRFRNAARDLERALAAAIENDEKPVDAQQIAMARGLAAELREVEAVGRITVETDPAKLAVRPELDMLLESGDRIFIPKRPLTVRVSGEVLSPAALQFRQEKKPLEYIDEAGGFTFHADRERAFVLYPDGSAQPLQVSPWNYKPVFIPPGSTLIVPRDPKPFDFIQSAKDISQILSNLAITAIFLDDVRDGD